MNYKVVVVIMLMICMLSMGCAVSSTSSDNTQDTVKYITIICPRCSSADISISATGYGDHRLFLHCNKCGATWSMYSDNIVFNTGY